MTESSDKRTSLGYPDVSYSRIFKSRAAFHFDSYLRLPSGLFFLCRPSSSYLLHRLRSGLASAILPASRRMPGATLREFHSLSII